MVILIADRPQLRPPAQAVHGHVALHVPTKQATQQPHPSCSVSQQSLPLAAATAAEARSLAPQAETAMWVPGVILDMPPSSSRVWPVM